MEKGNATKAILGFLLLLMSVGMILLLSCGISWALCWCFGLKWTLKAGIGVAVIWLTLYLTLHIFFCGIDEEGEDGE